MTKKKNVFEVYSRTGDVKGSHKEAIFDHEYQDGDVEKSLVK